MTNTLMRKVYNVKGDVLIIIVFGTTIYFVRQRIWHSNEHLTILCFYCKYFNDKRTKTFTYIHSYDTSRIMIILFT